MREQRKLRVIKSRSFFKNWRMNEAKRVQNEWMRTGQSPKHMWEVRKRGTEQRTFGGEDKQKKFYAKRSRIKMAMNFSALTPGARRQWSTNAFKIWQENWSIRISHLKKKKTIRLSWSFSQNVIYDNCRIISTLWMGHFIQLILSISVIDSQKIT